MTKTKVLVFGDSFTFGHGCSDKVYYFDNTQNKFVGTYLDYNTPPSNCCWASLLQNKFNDYDVVNYAIPGNSMQGTFSNLLNHNLSDVKLVIFNGTFFDRIQVPLSDKPEILISYIVQWPHHNSLEPAEYTKAKIMYGKYLYTEQIGYNQGISALFAAHSYVTSHGVNFLWSLPYVKEHPITIDKMKSTLKSISDSEVPFIYKYDFSGTGNIDFNNQCEAIDGHVNDLGHQMYFDKIILPAVQKIL